MRTLLAALLRRHPRARRAADARATDRRLKPSSCGFRQDGLADYRIDPPRGIYLRAEFRREMVLPPRPPELPATGGGGRLRRRDRATAAGSIATAPAHRAGRALLADLGDAHRPSRRAIGDDRHHARLRLAATARTGLGGAPMTQRQDRPRPPRLAHPRQAARPRDRPQVVSAVKRALRAGGYAKVQGRPWRHARSAGVGRAADRARRGDQACRADARRRQGL